MQGLSPTFDVLPPLNVQPTSETFQSSLTDWEKAQSTHQQDVVSIVLKAWQRKSTSIDLSGHAFTSLPPLPPSVLELLLNRCTQLESLANSLPSQLEHLAVGECFGLKNLPDKMPPNLTHLSINHTNLATLPRNLNNLKYLVISGCPNWEQLADTLPDNLSEGVLKNDIVLHSDSPFLARISHRQDAINQVKNRLKYLFNEKWDTEARIQGLEKWKSNLEKTNAFKDYLTIDMWKNSEACHNSAFFMEQQLHLLMQMDNHVELREKCLDIAYVASLCQYNNPLCGFLSMREHAREIEVLQPNNPNTSVSNWFLYMTSLKNKLWLEKIITDTPDLQKATVGAGTQSETEAMLMLYFLCHQKGIHLPAPWTSVGDEELGWKKFGDKPAEAIKAAISQTLDKALPQLTPPDASFFIQQPVWLHYLDKIRPAIATKKDAITDDARRKINQAEAALRYQKTPERIGEDPIDADMDSIAITANRRKAIEAVYLEETQKLLSNTNCIIF